MSIDTAAIRAEINSALDEIDRLRADLDELGVYLDFWRFRAVDAESRLGVSERRLATAEMHLRERVRGEELR